MGALRPAAGLGMAAIEGPSRGGGGRNLLVSVAPNTFLSEISRNRAKSFVIVRKSIKSGPKEYHTALAEGRKYKLRVLGASG